MRFWAAMPPGITRLWGILKKKIKTFIVFILSANVFYIKNLEIKSMAICKLQSSWTSMAQTILTIKTSLEVTRL